MISNAYATATPIAPVRPWMSEGTPTLRHPIASLATTAQGTTVSSAVPGADSFRGAPTDIAVELVGPPAWSPPV